MRPGLRGLPGVFQAHAAAFEVAGVACGQQGAARPGDGGNLGIELCDRTALYPASGGDFRKGAGGLFVEDKNASGKSCVNIASASAGTRSRRLPEG
jgi:hypothetical protein